MCPEPSLSRQQGAGLPIAIFIITVLALIVTSMAQQQESSGAAISQQILSQRAFYAAESGAQAAVTRRFTGAVVGPCPALWTSTRLDYRTVALDLNVQRCRRISTAIPARKLCSP